MWRNPVFSLLVFGVIGCSAIGWTLAEWLPAFYHKSFPIISLVLLTGETAVVAFVQKAVRRLDGKKAALLYLSIMVVKMLLVLFVTAFYALVIKENTRAFAMSLILVFMLFLALEAWACVRIEKNLKNK
ncbi:MAG: hypothetical protein LBS16_03445 [Prevotellaceae bacterium]|jgi:hypothetical protein|nr:hypothetical protein [Prevotellaceae bacterium]